MLEATLEALKFVNSPTDFLIKKFSKTAEAEPSSAGLAELQQQAQRTELEMRIAESEAKVAQELAIAKRIENAEEVEMTEFYEYSGEGQVGVQALTESFSIGASGAGRRISKRKFIFRGGSAAATGEELTKALTEANSEPSVTG